MIRELLNLFCSSPKGLQNRQENITVSPVVIAKDETDIDAIIKYYGPLTPGKIIETDLQTLLSVVPRARRKRDAYRKLQRELKENYDVTLEILPRVASTTNNNQR